MQKNKRLSKQNQKIRNHSYTCIIATLQLYLTKSFKLNLLQNLSGMTRPVVLAPVSPVVIRHLHQYICHGPNCLKTYCKFLKSQISNKTLLP